MRCGLLILLLSVSCAVTAQTFKEGSIRLKGGQEQPGLIGELRSGSPEGIEFKGSKDDGEVKIYYANEVEGYTVDKIFYTAFHNNKYRETDWSFVELMADGKLTLIRRNNMYFIRKAETVEFIHLAGHYKQMLSKMTKDCPVVSARAGRVSLDRAPLTEFINAYNECAPSAEANLEGMPKPITIGVVIGYDLTLGKFDDNAATRFLSANKQSDRSYLQAGVELNLKSYKVSKFIGLYTGAVVNFNSYSGTNKSTSTKQVAEVNEYSFSYKEIRIPIGIDISRPTLNKSLLHVRLGVIVPIVFGVTSSHPYSEVDNGVAVYYQDPSKLTLIKPGVMTGGSVGYEFKISESSIRIQAGWFAGKVEVTSKTGDDPETNTSGKLSSLNLTATYIF